MGNQKYTHIGQIVASAQLYYKISMRKSASKGSDKRSKGTTKYWISKEFITSQYEFLGNFIEDAISDVVGTGIYHKIDDKSAKAIISDKNTIISRVYYIDGKEKFTELLNESSEDYKKYDLLQNLVNINDSIAKKELKYKDLQEAAKRGDITGLLQSLLYRIIIGDFDNKLDNYSCDIKYSKEGNIKEMHVGVIDTGLLFGEYQKNWEKDEIEKIFTDNNNNITRNISEFIRAVGKRTDNEGKMTHIRYKPIITAILEGEIARIKEQQGLRSKSDAVLHVFNDLIAKIQENKKAVFDNVQKDIQEKITDKETIEQNTYNEKVEKIKEKNSTRTIRKQPKKVGGAFQQGLIEFCGKFNSQITSFAEIIVEIEKDKSENPEKYADKLAITQHRIPANNHTATTQPPTILDGAISAVQALGRLFKGIFK